MPKRAPRRRMLSELLVRKAKPERVTYLLWDLRQHGLALRVQPTGARSWVVIYRHHGRPRWYHLGNGNAIALSDARKLAARVALAVAEGKDPAAEKRAERGAGTFADLAVRYVEQHAKRRNKCWAQPDRLVRRYVLPRLGALQAASITRADVKALMASITAPVLGNQVLAAVSAIFMGDEGRDRPHQPLQAGRAPRDQEPRTCPCRQRGAVVLVGVRRRPGGRGAQDDLAPRPTPR